MTEPAVTALNYNRTAKLLEISFDDGVSFALPAELLRVESPSAEVRGHGAGPKQIVGGKQQVTITGMEPVGNYAVRLIFDDGHDSGLYSWRLLREMGETQDQLWNDYLAALADKSLSRSG